MGHRYYMYKISKDLLNEIKSMTYEELAEKFKSEEEGFHLADLPKKEICEFGRLYWDDTAEHITFKVVPLFERKEVMHKLSDHEPYAVGKIEQKGTQRYYSLSVKQCVEQLKQLINIVESECIN